MARKSKKQPPNEIGKFLQVERQKLKLEQGEFAIKAGLNSRTYNGYEVGGKPLSKKVAIYLANFFNINEEIFFTLMKNDKKMKGLAIKKNESSKLKEEKQQISSTKKENNTMGKNDKEIHKEISETTDTKRHLSKSYENINFITNCTNSLEQLIDAIRKVKKNWNNPQNLLLDSESNKVLFVENHSVVLQIINNHIILYFLNKNSFIITLCNDILGESLLFVPLSDTEETQNINPSHAGYSIWVDRNCSYIEKINMLISIKPETLLTTLNKNSLKLFQ